MTQLSTQQIVNDREKMVDLYKNDRSNSHNLTYKIVVAKIIVIYVVLELLEVKNLNITW